MLSKLPIFALRSKKIYPNTFKMSETNEGDYPVVFRITDSSQEGKIILFHDGYEYGLEPRPPSIQGRMVDFTIRF